MTISKRAKALQSAPSAIMIGHSICAENPYSLENPEGFLNYGTAQNHLMNDYLLPMLNKAGHLKPEHIQYSSLHGLADVRETVTHFISSYLNIHSLNPDNLVIQTGVSAICESLSFAMFDKDDIIMIPTPYYTGFEHDFTKRFGCHFLKVHQSAENFFGLDIETFKQTYISSENKDKIKAVLITHPNNPTGEVISEEFMLDLISFCKENDLEILSDEIYALSNLHGNEHLSLYQKAKDAGAKTHLLYGMAKDFALAGLKVGFFYSEDEELITAMKNVSYFHPVATSTQLQIKSLLNDQDFLNKYIPENQKRLATISVLIRTQLPHLDFIPCESGLFMLLDLSQYCESFEKEKQIFEYFLDHFRINMTPGKDMGMNTPGYFRVCFAQNKESTLEFITRMKKLNLNEL